MIPLFRVAMHESAAGAVSEVLGSGYIGQGPKVEEFEAALAALLDAPYPPLSVNAGTSALDLALHLAGVGPGDEVVSTPMTCTATNGAVVRRGATIRWADIDPATGLIDPEDVARKITRRTKAVVAVDWGGHACDYIQLKSFGLPVIEDAAHALLTRVGATATDPGEPIATAGGDYVCFSFQAIKHLTTGDGGALLPPERDIERGRLLRWFGLDRRSGESFRCEQQIHEAGYKYHLNDIAAAIGLANIGSTLDLVSEHRRRAEMYHKLLGGIPGITLPRPDPGSSWWVYTILVEDRPSFTRFMTDRGVTVSPVHSRNDTHPAFQFPSGPLPGVDHFAARNVAVPVGWWLSDEAQLSIAQAIEDWSSLHRTRG